jgi:hypothetical protein
VNLLFSLLLLTVAAPKVDLKVHVFTRIDPSGFVDAAQKQRVDSARALRKVFTKDSKRFNSVLVESPEEAHISIEVTSAAMEDLGDRAVWSPATGFFGGSHVSRRPIIRTEISVDGHTIELVSPKNARNWETAAAMFQKIFREWVDTNTDRLLTVATR